MKKYGKVMISGISVKYPEEMNYQAIIFIKYFLISAFAASAIWMQKAHGKNSGNIYFAPGSKGEFRFSPI
ncbi:hypothetical protein [Methanolacinia petrolearia]|uniref:hypothetical protein n=1 Tax=Methanolacinia petrolearia TaxID=54120 RepID=UPI003BAA1AA4